MPLAKYITSFLNLEEGLAIADAQSGFYNESELESLYRNEKRPKVRKAIAGMMANDPEEKTAVAKVGKSKSDTGHFSNPSEKDHVKFLEALASQINEDYEIYLSAEKTVVGNMLKIGLMMEKAKELLPHGQLQKWVSANLSISYRHAHRFRQLAQVFIKANQLGQDEVYLLCDPANSRGELASKLTQMAMDFIGDKTQAELFEQYKIKYQEKAEPKQLHLPKPKPLDPGETQAHRDATELIYPLMAQIHKYIVGDERVVQHFTMAELKTLQGDLIDAKRVVDGLIKAG